MLRIWHLRVELWRMVWLWLGFFIIFWLLAERRIKYLKYSDICQAFYFPKEIGGKTVVEIGIKGARSQQDIAERLMTLGWSNESTEGILPDNISTYNKWFYGKTGQKKDVWKRFDKDYNEDKYVRLLETDIDETLLPRIAEKLGIVNGSGKTISKHRVAVAIARQMKLFSQSREGKNAAENQIPDIYYAGEIALPFDDYIKKATDRYNVIKLIGGQEVSLEKYYVCNTLGEKQKVIADKNDLKCKYLDNATIQGIREMYKDRRQVDKNGNPVVFDNRKSILIGCGGSGKTLMLQHLFLDGIEKYPDTKMLPIFIELRYFKQSDEIESFIFQIVNRKDATFTEDIFRQLLIDGRCPILMDGLDEIDPWDINDFHMKLNAFMDKYPRVQVILASRECGSISGLNKYTKLYVWPFDNNQSIRLIDKILNANNTQAAKGKILEYIDHGFIKKDGAFVSHPMLLTFVAMNYPQYEEFYGNHLLFYRRAYEALLTGHDDNKKPYDRVFHSVDNADQFSAVFKEFCGRTYSEGKMFFDDSTFELYFKQIEAHKSFENSGNFTLTSFKHDVCSTACMMYESEYKLWYIDPGFQEFLFAEYYAEQPTEVVKALGASLRGVNQKVFNKLDAFDMLYEFTKEKMEVCILLPYLESIFKGKSEEQAFMDFIINGYETFTYTVIDDPAIVRYEQKRNVKREIRVPGINEPGTVILAYIAKIIGIDPNFVYTTKDIKAQCDGFSKIALTGEYAYVNGSEEALYLRRNLQLAFNDAKKFEEQNDASHFIRDDDGKIICFGHEYQIDAIDMYEEPEKFKGVIDTMIRENSDAYKIFLRLKEFNKQLRKEQFKHRFK